MNPSEPSPLEQWKQVAASLPDLPDNVFDAQRQRFFKESVVPWAMRQGYNTDTARQAFMSASERPNKSSYPRLAVAANAAARTIIDPLAGLSSDPLVKEGRKEIGAETQEIHREAERQGVGTAIPEMIGTGVGAIPFIMGGTELAGAAGITGVAGRIAGFAISQGAMDAAKAEDGQRLIKGFEGGVEGAVVGGIFEGILHTPGLLKTSSTAKAVERTVRGVATPEEQEIAKAIEVVQPKAGEEVVKQAAKDSEAAAKMGVPRNPPEVQGSGKAKVTLRKKDGTVYEVPDSSDIQSRLAAGESIDQILGSAAEIHKVQVKLDKVNAKAKKYDVAIPLERPGLPVIKANGKVDSFEADLKPPEAEELPVASTSASVFELWAEDHFEKTLQGKVLDQSIPLSARDAAYTRLKKLNPGAADDVDTFLHGAPKEEIASVAMDSLEVVAKVEKKSPLLPIYKAMSGKQEVNINSLISKVGLGWKEAEDILARGVEEGILTPSRKILKQGGVEEVQVYAVKPRKIGVEDLPESPKFQATSNPVDDQLKALRERVKEKYPQAQFEEPPKSPPTPGEEPPSELEVQLKASLDKLGVKYQEGAMPHQEFGHLSQGQFVAEAMDTQSFESVQEAIQFYQANVKNYSPGSELSFRERPLANTWAGSNLNPEGFSAATYPMGEGNRATIVYPTSVPRSTIYHEGTHALVSAAGLSADVAEIFGDEFAAKIFNGALDGEAAKFYQIHTPEYIPEETFVWLAQAYRHGDRRLLQSFIDADGSEAELAKWYTGKVQEVLGRTNGLEDSIYKRRLQMRLNDLGNRASRSLQEMSSESSVLGYEVDHIDGQYALRGGDGSIQYFKSREHIADYLRDNHSTPMIAPELLDLTGLAEGTPLYQASRPPGNRAPIHTNPAPPELRPGKDINAGMHVLSYYFRPFYGWVDSVAEKFKWPELSERMRGIQDAEITMNNATRDHLKTLKETIGKVPHTRQDLLFKLIEAKPEQRFDVAESLGLTQEERDLVTQFNQRFTDPLEGEFGNISLEHFIRKYHGPGQRDLSSVSSEAITNRAASGDIKFLGDSYRSGDLDPRDQNLLNIAAEYLRTGMRKKFMEDPLKQAAELVNASGPDKVYVAGNLQPLLARHINYLRGVPDYGARIVHEGIRTSMNIINEGLEVVNKKLPESWKIEPLDNPEAALQKWVTYNYAGGLMLRMMVPMRDSLQYFMTTYPILGGKYSMKGIQMLMEAKGAPKDSDIISIPKKYGAMLDDRDLLKYVTGSDNPAMTGKIDKMVENGMKVMQLSNNSNRFAAFWGHSSRILDALDELGTGTIVNRETFAEKAGMNYLSKTRRNSYLDELLVVTPDKRPDFAYRVAKDLVDVSQWGTSRGSAPGFYKYALGKLFGQYGTWPLNYLEYARKLTGLGDSAISGKEKVQSLTRLALAHTAILKAGDTMGVDTGSWVFTQPIAYGGGPMFSAVTSIPGTMDFETEKGAQARRNVVRPIWPMSVPGGLFAENVLKGIRNDDPDLWKIILGFHPMEKSEYGKGIHLIPPNLNEENFR